MICAHLQLLPPRNTPRQSSQLHGEYAKPWWTSTHNCFQLAKLFQPHWGIKLGYWGSISAAIGWSGNSVTDEGEKLENISNIMIKWFKYNLVKVKPIKFHLILFDCANNIGSVCLNQTNRECQCYVRILWVHFDVNLHFNVHITGICKKAFRKLNLLVRLSKNA
jgi:hypothetical protein